MKNENNKNNNGNGHNGNGFTATVEAVKTNGNGNCSKKVEAPVDTFKLENRVTIVPRFDQLSSKGVEMFKNMGDLENAKLFLDDLAAETNVITIASLIALLDAISEKAENSSVIARDFIDSLQDRLFHWTLESMQAKESYIQAVKTGNFMVDTFVNSDTKETEEKVDFRIREKGETDESFPELLEDSAEEVEEPALSDSNDRLAQHYLSILANKVHHVLTSDKVSDDVKENLQFIIFSAGNEANLGIDDPDLIKSTFPKLINSLDFQYGKGIVDSLHAILDNSLSEEVDRELYQYSTRLETLEDKTETV